MKLTLFKNHKKNANIGGGKSKKQRSLDLPSSTPGSSVHRREQDDTTRLDTSNSLIDSFVVPSSIILQKSVSKAELGTWMKTMIKVQERKVSENSKAIVTTKGMINFERHVNHGISMQTYHNMKLVQRFEARRAKATQDISLLQKLLMEIDEELTEEFYTVQAYYEQEAFGQLSKPAIRPWRTASATT
jgi:hypothetical protein